MEWNISFDKLKSELKELSGQQLLEVRTYATGICNRQEKWLENETRSFYTGGENKLGDAQSAVAKAELYLRAVNDEIELRKLTMGKQEITVTNNHGIIQTGDNSSANLTVNKTEPILSPIPTQKQESKFKDIVSKYWWTAIIPLIIAVIALWIEAKWFK